ncbi:MAG TPA: LiaF domain-containing protein [Actinomycetota bacterium]|nr:LiaF domain-containing protein [Actinomycetota bacterium]
MTAVPEPPPPPEGPPGTVRVGRIVLGVLVVLVGVGWLLEVLDVADFAWDVILPAALILIGGALLLSARSARGHGPLITIGVVLTVILLVGSTLDLPFEGGVGQRGYHPTAADQIRTEYRLGIGELTLDLTDAADVAVGTTERVRVRVGIGRLLVIVPSGASARVEARATLGNVQVLGEESSGLGAERLVEPGSGPPTFDLVLSVGLGQVEVRRG